MIVPLVRTVPLFLMIGMWSLADDVGRPLWPRAASSGAIQKRLSTGAIGLCFSMKV